jgi:hypothetical protein
MVIVVSLGAFALVSNASTVDAAVGPRLNMRVSAREIRGVEATDHWFYVTNPLISMDRGYEPPYEIHHVVELIDLDAVTVSPTGVIEETPNLHALLPARWNPIIKPRETVLVFYVGWYVFPETGLWTISYTLEAEYEGDTYIFEETIRIRVSE